MGTYHIQDFTPAFAASRCSASQSVIVDTDIYKNGNASGAYNGGFAFLVVARSWWATNDASSMYLVSGIQNGLYESCVQIVKETNGPTVSMSNNHVKIQFRSVDGGFYCIVPLFNILLP